MKCSVVANQVDQGFHDPVVLGVDVDSGLRELLEELRQQRDGFPPGYSRTRNLAPRKVGNLARTVSDPVKSVVVEGENHSIQGGMNVRLQIPVPKVYGVSEGGQTVLGVFLGSAPMGEGQGPRVIKERVGSRTAHLGNGNAVFG